MIYINLGGVCGNSNWREKFCKMIDTGLVTCFNPVKNNGWKWDLNAKIEKQNRVNKSDFLVFVITPELSGYSSIASAVDYSNKMPKKVLFCALQEDNGKHFTSHQKESLKTVIDIIKDNGGKIFSDLQELARFINFAACN